jgi:hypothetical protein
MGSPKLVLHKDLTGDDLHNPKAHAESHHSSGSDPLEYVYTQEVPSATWNIRHNLGKFPSVIVVDTAGSVVVGETKYISVNEIQLVFSSAFSGSAYLT